MARGRDVHSSRTLGAAVDERARANAFDLIRLVAALAVLASHALPLTGHEENFGRESLGQIGVCVFFAISGFLVSRSWVMQPRLAVFAAKRGLRLYPALIVVLLLTVFVLGPLVTTLSLRSYSSAPETHQYLGQNLLLHTRYTLPGVFTDLPYPLTVNGSLWTLPVEVKCYAFVALFGLVGLIGRRPWGVAAVAVAFCLLTIQRVRDGLPHGDAIADLAGHGSEPLVLIAVFAVASLLFTIRDRLPLAWTPVLVALAVWAATIPLSGHRFATVLLLPYWVIGLAYLISWDGIRRALRGTDLSYGTYLYAFPMEQLVSTVFRPGPVLMIIVAAPLTLVCAAVSWMLIERPSLSLKPRGRAAPAAAQVTARA